MEEIECFVEKYNKSDNLQAWSQNDVLQLESELRMNLPLDFKRFVTTYGSIYTPNILDEIVENDLDLNDVQEFWDKEQIIHDKKNEWTSNLSQNLLPIASDSMGNIFAFLIEELNEGSDSSSIYLYDHDMDTLSKVANSFTFWLEKFNRI